MNRIGLLLLLIFPLLIPAQDTFSIVAVDSVTGEVGSAGATCLDSRNIAGGAFIISDLVPGRGAIHTQSFWIPQNQNYAGLLLRNGLAPQQIIDSLVKNDARGDSTQRQYGVVDFAFGNTPRSAAFTGSNCLDVKAHIVGPNYAIQGNILLNRGILDSMEARFLRTPGELADKLMAAMQGANVPGADSRCLSEGVSSRSAFLRVAKPLDRTGGFYLDLLVDRTAFGQEPIDSLQTLFDEWKGPASSLDASIPTPRLEIYQDIPLRIGIRNPKTGTTYNLNVYDLQGRLLTSIKVNPKEQATLPSLPLVHTQLLLLELTTKNQIISREKLLWRTED